MHPLGVATTTATGGQLPHLFLNQPSILSLFDSLDNAAQLLSLNIQLLPVAL